MNSIVDLTSNASTTMTLIRDKILTYGPKIILAIVVWLIGVKVIRVLVKLAEKAMHKSKIEHSLKHFLEDLISIGLKVLLLISVLGMLGVETTSFIAVLGAAGLAIGLALQGSLSNFAGGVLILMFKPFKVGDLIEAQGEFGTVKKITIFMTKILSPENKMIYIPNGVLADGNIRNYTEEGNIRVDVKVGVSYSADIKSTKKVLEQVLEKQEYVLDKPASGVMVSELGDSSVNLIVRAFVKPEYYRDVYFGLTENSKLALDKNNIEIPFPQQVVHFHDAGKEK